MVENHLMSRKRQRRYVFLDNEKDRRDANDYSDWEEKPNTFFGDVEIGKRSMILTIY
jgi:hypothetical protein